MGIVKTLFARIKKKGNISICQPSDDVAFYVIVRETEGILEEPKSEAMIRLSQNDLNEMAKSLDGIRNDQEAESIWECNVCGQEKPCTFSPGSSRGYVVLATCPQSGGMKVKWERSSRVK